MADDTLQSLDWITRSKIAIGAAEGLCYLHHECVPPFIHRDIQTTSILLDDEFEVRLGSLSQVHAQQNVITARCWRSSCFVQELTSIGSLSPVVKLDSLISKENPKGIIHQQELDLKNLTNYNVANKRRSKPVNADLAMGLRRDRGYCYAEAKPCTEWVLVYFKDCLCNLKDEVSFGLGLLSVTCWALAEIPQIVTNFKAKSSQGVSLMLLLTWILGDLFNLAGCALEPSTLPTQFYTALLYTVGSLILVGQVIYYDYITTWFKKSGRKDSQIVILEDEDSIAKPLLSPECVDSSKAINVHGARPVPRSPAYYISARSLATSPSSFEARFPNLIGDHEKHATPSNRGSFLNQPRRVVNSVAGYGTFIAAAANLPNQTGALNRLVLQKNLLNEDQSGPYGQIMGWGMAVIYISGRVPQILLNMRRGNVEGLSPLMFIFALMGNTTYILSILVRSSKWVDVKANMPWLLDAAFCVSLDLLILLQFAYYKYQKSKQNKYSVRQEARNFLA